MSPTSRPLSLKYPAIGNPLVVPAIPRGLLEITNRPLASCTR